MTIAVGENGPMGIYPGALPLDILTFQGIENQDTLLFVLVLNEMVLVLVIELPTPSSTSTSTSTENVGKDEGIAPGI